MTDQRNRWHAAFRLNLEQQKNRAKDLLKAAKAGDRSAWNRMRSLRPQVEPAVDAADLKLADAQLAIAQELGFPSWAKLKVHIASMDRERAVVLNKQGGLDAELKTLHIRCGSDIEATLADAGFVGDFLEYSNPYCQGPVTENPDHIEQRARFLAAAYGRHMGFSVDDALAKHREAERRLAASAHEYRRVVLWMEHDSYDQLVLIRCLAHYASAQRPQVLQMVNIDSFPGSARFIGLGQLPPEALRLLWERKQPIVTEQLNAGAAAWAALKFGDPRQLAALMRARTPALPILWPALRRHLQELPWIENGLSLTERLVLQILAEEPSSIQRVFQLLMLEREPLPWLGDLMLLHIIERMEQAAEKILIRSSEGADLAWPKHRLEITELGRAVLRGERDWLSCNPPERWVGGVRIDPSRPSWRWNEIEQAAVPPSTR